MKFNIFNRAPSSRKEADTDKKEKPSNIESPEIVMEVIKKLAEFKDNLDRELSEHTADDYVKNLMQLEKFSLSSNQAEEITTIHSEIMKRLGKSGKLKEFTQGLISRDRIKTLSSAIGAIGRMQNQK